MLQRQISIHDESETETGQEALEEPLKAKKRRESDNWKGRKAKQLGKLLNSCNKMHIFKFGHYYLFDIVY